MISLPTELQLDILQLATHVPHLFEITPSPIDACYPKCETLDVLIKDFRRSLPTRCALTLVSRAFNVLATPILYACILLTPTSVSRICTTLNTCTSSMVRHVIMELPSFKLSEAQLDRNLESIFAILHNVRILSLRAKRRSQEHVVQYSHDYHACFPRAMGESLGSTLRKLHLHNDASMLFPPGVFSTFTSALVHLEVLISSTSGYHSLDLSPRAVISFPASLPSLTYLDIDRSPFKLPDDITPTHVHHPIDAHLPSVISPALTHLSLTVPYESFDVYTSLSTKAPNLTSLALSGFLHAIARTLTHYPVPAVSHIIFPEKRLSKYAGEMLRWPPPFDIIYTVKCMRAWIDALAMMGMKQPTVRKVSVLDDAFVKTMGQWVREGRVDVGALEGCGFALEDGDGRALLDVIRANGES